MDERIDSATRNEHARELHMAHQAFAAATLDWRRGRPEFATLCELLRKKVEGHVLEVAAAKAGSDIEEIGELRACRDRALRVLPNAKDHSARQTALDEIERLWADNENKFNVAATPGVREGFEVTLLNSADARNAARQAATESRLAAETVALAASMGLI